MTTETEIRLAELQALYIEMFDELPPNPIGVTDERLIELLSDALETGDPIEDSHEDLPPGAVA